MHEEVVVQGVPKEWDRSLEALLHEQEALYERVRASARRMRKALVHRDHPEVGARVRELQALISQLRTHEKRAAAFGRECGILDSTEAFTLSRLNANEKIRSHSGLRSRLESVTRVARNAARDAALNRRLIERLSAWNHREIQVLMEPLSEAAGYGKAGMLRDSAPAPAMVDRRG